MELVGLFLIIASIWGLYCGVESFNPLAVALAILNSPNGAAGIVASAKAQRDASVAVQQTSADNTNAAPGVNPFSLTTNLGSGKYGPFAGYNIVSGFGDTKGRSTPHQGIDFQMPVGTALYSPFSGTVINHPNYNSAAGNQVVVKLANGYTFMIDHVSKFLLNNGTKITAGQEIALSGGAKGAPGSGDSSGPHAHVELRTPGNQAVVFNSIPFG